MNEDAHPASLLNYIIGFVLSILFTLTAYFCVANRLLTGQRLVLAIAGLAIVQLLVQLVFFLHLGKESRPRWNLMAFFFMLVVVGIVVIGSLWIMDNLNYNMMPHEVDSYIKEEEGIR